MHVLYVISILIKSLIWEPPKFKNFFIYLAIFLVCFWMRKMQKYKLYFQVELSKEEIEQLMNETRKRVK